MSYAAYLRVYEPMSAFHEPERSRWTVYAASDARPRRHEALAAEQAEALRRIVTSPSGQPPEKESEHAYVRSADGVVYVCPWQTRLRSLLAAGLRVDRHPAGAARGPAGRPHIRSSNWTIPMAWFVPFAGAERWVALGTRTPCVQWGAEMRATARTARTLVYVTPMASARRRVARGLAALRGQPEIETDLAAVARWLEGFHPYSLVELDYGGLVYLLSDDALWGDESVAELAAAIDAMSRGHCELAAGMYSRTQLRWQVFSESEQVN